MFLLQALHLMNNSQSQERKSLTYAAQCSLPPAAAMLEYMLGGMRERERGGGGGIWQRLPDSHLPFQNSFHELQ